MYELVPYDSTWKEDWDSFIAQSKNGTFLFFRDYMDYHADRFVDSSFICLKKGRIVAILPCNRDGDTIFSHQGLTFGGLVMGRAIGAKDVLSIFRQLNMRMAELGVQKVIYKPVPYIYHSVPAQEDLYALYRFHASHIACNIASTIRLDDRIPFTKSRRGGSKKARKAGVTVVPAVSCQKFWEILTSNLQHTHGVRPVHSVEEMQYLQSLFPENIKLYVTEYQDTVVGGAAIYETDLVAHVQYIAASEEGKHLGALDLLFDELVNGVFATKLYFDFGHSNEKMGAYLNEGLLFQKEGFGGRGVTYNVYEYSPTEAILATT